MGEPGGIPPSVFEREREREKARERKRAGYEREEEEVEEGEGGWTAALFVFSRVNSGGYEHTS